MAIELFAAELMRFLRSDQPEVLCISGRWGVGKTYAWNYYLRRAQEANAVALKKYAYVSLFGRNSIEDVRTVIIENTVDSRVVGQKPDLKSFESLTSQFASRTKTITKIASIFHGTTNYANSINRVLFLMLSNQIICIDDLERAGSGLGSNNIFGLISSLKEEKNCKVVILLNQEELSDENKTDFKVQLEKVVDTIMMFEPSPAESAEIAINKNNTFYPWIAENCQILGIVNIRVIRKIEMLSQRIFEVLSGHNPRVLKQAIHTITLAGYAKFQPHDAPPLELIKAFNSISDLMREKNDDVADENSGHKAILMEYGFQYIDELDAVIIEGVERGFFDVSAVRQRADVQQARLKEGDKRNAYYGSWSRFYDSFEDDQDSALDALVDATKANVGAIPPGNLSDTVSLLKEFGRHEQALDILRFYIGSRNETGVFWDIDASAFRGQVTDEDVRIAFKAKFNAAQAPSNPQEILKRINERDGWNVEDVAQLSVLTEVDYVRIFKGLKGDALKKSVTAALTFRNISNANEQMKAITRTVEGALKQIGAENPLNAKRVRAYGIEIENLRGERTSE